MQKPSTTLECKTLVALIESLSTNENAEDAIQRGHSKTDARQNDVAFIQFALFNIWHQLADKFCLHDALLKTYLDYCWNI